MKEPNETKYDGAKPNAIVVKIETAIHFDRKYEIQTVVTNFALSTEGSQKYAKSKNINIVKIVGNNEKKNCFRFF